MLITNGNISNLVKWFNNKNNKYDWLFLFVAGHLNDSQVFKKIFEKKETLDIISGHKIALILFHDETESATIFRAGTIGYTVACTLIKGLPHEDMTMIKINDLPEDIEITKKSQTMSAEISDYFNISLQNLPATLILEKHTKNPIIIKTRGIDDLNILIELLKDIQNINNSEDSNVITNKVSSEIDRIKSDIIAYNIILSRSENKLNSLYKKQERHLEEYNILVEKISNILLKSGIDKDRVVNLLSINNSEPWRKILENVVHSEPKLLKVYGKSIYIGGKTYSRCKTLLSLSHTIENTKNEIPKLKASIHNKAITIKDIEYLKNLNDKILPITLQVAEKYENKYKRKNDVESIKKLIKSLLGITKNAKDIIDIQDKLND